MKIELLLTFLTISLVINSCITDPESDYQKFKIKIDKITFSDTVSVNDTLSIKFDGFIGPNGCYNFQNFETHKKSNDIHITVWGKKPNYDAMCTQALVYLRGKEFRTVLNKRGLYKIIIYQPDNLIMLDSIRVE